MYKIKPAVLYTDEANHDNDMNYLHGQEAGAAKRLAIRIYP